MPAETEMALEMSSKIPSEMPTDIPTETPSQMLSQMGKKDLLSLVADVADDAFLETETPSGTQVTQTEAKRVTVEAVDPGGAVQGV